MDKSTLLSGAMIVLLLLVISRLSRVIRWARRKPAGAYIFLAIMPLLSLFPVPPSSFRNMAITKEQEQKQKESDDDKPNPSDCVDSGK